MLSIPSVGCGLVWPIFLTVMGLLVIVLMMGQIRNTARWIAGAVNRQPSELAKLAVILILGVVVAREDAAQRRFPLPGEDPVPWAFRPSSS